jgi:4a-hydroxytetrahydrobiopterin dehydratase
MMKKLDIEQAEPIRKKYCPSWEIRKGAYLYKKVAFDDYNQALRFFMVIEKPQIKLDHFADIGFFYNEVILMVYTHDVGGLTQLDFELALYIDKALEQMGARQLEENFAEQKAHNAIFQKILVDLLQKKYPDAEFDYQGDKVISADGKLTVIADLQVEDGYGGVWVWDVDTGPYKGVLGTAIKQATAELLRQQPDLKPALFVDGDNQNPGAWQAIANKLNYTLLDENFADGKKKGKSRPGRVKRSGASCNGSVTSLRKRAKNSSGEKARMYHWCANMKSGRKKK